MTVYSRQVSLPSGYSDGAGGFIPPVVTSLFPARDGAATVRLNTGSTYVVIGGPGAGEQNWSLPPNVEYVLTVPANEELWALFPSSTSATSPIYANVNVFIINEVPH